MIKALFYKRNKEPFFVFLFFLIIFLFICTSYKKESVNNLRRVDFYFSLPILNNRGHLINFHDSLTIFYTDSDVLFKLPYQSLLIDGTTEINSETSFKYFLYHKEQLNGFLLDSVNSNSFKKLSVDSFLTEKTFKGAKFVDKNFDSLVGVLDARDGFNLIEKYIGSKKKPDDSYPDTTILYYKQKFHDLGKSFSWNLEKSQQLQIAKIRLIYAKQYNMKSNIIFSYRELYLELKESQKIGSDDLHVFKLIKEKMKKYYSF